MRTKVLAVIYAIVKENPNAPLHAKNVANATGWNEKEIEGLFGELLNEGMIEKKYSSMNVYRITLNGMLQAGTAYKEYWQH